MTERVDRIKEVANNHTLAPEFRLEYLMKEIVKMDAEIDALTPVEIEVDPIIPISPVVIEPLGPPVLVEGVQDEVIEEAVEPE